MSIGPLSTTSIVPSIAQYGASSVGGRQWSSDPRIDEQNWTDLERLTASDRALIKQTTGQDIPTRSSGNPPVAPILAFQISGDRQSGALGTGQPVTASYIEGLASRYSGKPNPFGDQLDRALKYLTANPPANQLDVNA